jgi:hypothetical protein
LHIRSCDAGDWLKYNLIDKQTQDNLTIAAWGGLVVHSAIGLYGAADCIQSKSGAQSQSATFVQATAAAARAFLVGFMELARIVSVQQVRSSRQ